MPIWDAQTRALCTHRFSGYRVARSLTPARSPTGPRQFNAELVLLVCDVIAIAEAEVGADPGAVPERPRRWLDSQ